MLLAYLIDFMIFNRKKDLAGNDTALSLHPAEKKRVVLWKIVEMLWGKCEQKQVEKFAGNLRSLTFAVRPEKSGKLFTKQIDFHAKGF